MNKYADLCPSDETSERLTETKDSIAALRQFAGENYTLETRIEAGSALWAVIEDAQEALKDLKSDLREIALDSLGGDGVWTHDGTGEGYAKVVIPSESIRIKKGADTDSLASLNLFKECFEVVTTVKPRKGASSNIMKLGTLDERNKLLDVIESVNSTPRVSLKRR